MRNSGTSSTSLLNLSKWRVSPVRSRTVVCNAPLSSVNYTDCSPSSSRSPSRTARSHTAPLIRESPHRPACTPQPPASDSVWETRSLSHTQDTDTPLQRRSLCIMMSRAGLHQWEESESKQWGSFVSVTLMSHTHTLTHTHTVSTGQIVCPAVEILSGF